MNIIRTSKSNPARLAAGKVSFVFLRCLLLAAAGFMLGQNAKATLFFTDQFNYPNNSNLGTNISCPWNTTTSGVGDNTTQIKVTTASAQTSPSGFATAAFSGVVVAPAGSNKKNAALFNGATGVPVGNGNVVYASFLLNVQTLPSANMRVAYMHNTTASSAGIEVVVSSTGQVGIQKKGSGTTFVSGTPVSTPGTHLVVMRYTFQAGNDEVAVWVDPDGSTYAAGTAPATNSVGAAATTGGGSDMAAAITYIAIDSPGLATGPVFWIDEVRVGTAWADVTPASGVCNTATVTTPANTSVTTGQPATFTISASISSSPTYQWQKSTTAGGSTYTNIPSANFASYTNLVTAAADDGFKYRCVVSVSCDSSTATSAGATLTVSCNSAGVAVGPNNAAVTAGQTANFIITPTGSSATYQWEYSTDNGSSWLPVASGTGATTTNYTTAATTVGQDGYLFHCVVTVACNSSTATSGSALLSVSCSTAGISANPTDRAVPTGSTATFSVTATGSSPTYLWEVSTDGGTSWTPTGGTLASYTTPATSSGDNNSKFHCIVSVACDTSAVTSSAATLTVIDPSATSYRSAASGNWSNPSIWQISGNNGGTWLATGVAPTAANCTNILISNPTSVTNAAATTADQIVVASGGTLVITNTMTVAAGSPLDLDVFGTVLGIGGSSTLTIQSGVAVVIESGGVLDYDGTSTSAFVANSGTITFNSGGKFLLAKPGGVVPTATWNPGSTCEIHYSSASTSKPNGISQTFANFTWNNPLQSGSVDLAGALTNINGNFLVTAANGQGIKWGGDANFGGNLTINDGNLNISSDSNPRVWTLTGDLTIGSGGTLNLSATVSAANQIILNGTTQNFTCNGTYTANKLYWTVNPGTTLNLNSSLPIYSGSSVTSAAGRAMTNNGTVNLNGNTLAADNVAGTGTFRNQGGGNGLLVLGLNNGTNTLDGTLALLNGASGTLGLVKGGNSASIGLLNITAPFTFSGGLLVSNGFCFVNNSTGSGTGSGGISVLNGTLGGTGAVTGPVVFTGGKLSPGVDGTSIGTFTVNGTLTLAGNMTMDVNKGVGQDQVVATTVNYGGSLTIVTNGSAFVLSDTFPLFTAGSRTATFTNINGNPGANLAWSFNPTNGVLSVITGAPPTLNVGQSGNSLLFTWTDATFKLQSQTNSLSTGLNTNSSSWFDYPGGGTSGVTVTINPANPTVFFRLSQ
jgi:hypothetical protein